MKERIYLNDGWSFSPRFEEKMIQPKYSGDMEKVRLPHTVAVTPFNNFDEGIYQKISAYRMQFTTEPKWKGKRVLLTIEGAAHQSEVFLNGKSVGTHGCGYTAFTVDLTDGLYAAGKKNTLVVKVDSQESLDIPPFGYVIDYMTYGGIYRDVYLEIKNTVYIADVSVATKANHFTSSVVLNTTERTAGYSLHQKIVPYERSGAEPSAELATGISGLKTLTAADAAPVQAWSLEHPILYVLVTELLDSKDKVVDVQTTRFGFRDIRFDSTGFYLNNKKIKLRGLNRHQSYPYVGYAMPKNIQREDADILKYQLGLNEVRTSHYPQSQYFVDRCDEIGLLVFTEIPGWQHIGGKEWKKQAVQNVRDMVTQYRNHPSVFMWGVRINESLDDDDLYTQTNVAARELDPTRPTAGVRYLKNSHLLEDVYTFNDFSHTGRNAGVLHKDKVTDSQKGYMVTEYNGHMFPTKSFDDEKHRTEHALRHANVLETVAEYDEIAGSSGWCAFDYNTHKDFGSGDRICYHGVMDMFRNPKMAAAVYRSQGEPDVVGDVLEVSSSMDIGEYPASIRGQVWIFTNADSVKMYINNIFIKQYSCEDSPYTSLPHGPVLVDDYIGTRLVNEDHIPAEHAEELKAVIMDASRYGQDHLPLKSKLLAFKLIALHIVSKERLYQLGGKYIGNWGMSSVVYRFEACRNGKVVRTVTKSACRELSIIATASTDQLVESNSYDVVSVHLSAVDEYDNVQPYYQEAVTLSTTGPIELIGPSVVSLKGGQAGTYVRSTGVAGKASLLITDVDGKESEMTFTVKIQK